MIFDGPCNIRVNAIAPGSIMTERQLEKWLTPESEAELMQRQCLKLIPDENYCSDAHGNRRVAPQFLAFSNSGGVPTPLHIAHFPSSVGSLVVAFLLCSVWGSAIQPGDATKGYLDNWPITSQTRWRVEMAAI
jgi:hypothetical protein